MPRLRLTYIALFLLVVHVEIFAQTPPSQREVLPGISTTRIVQGQPYELRGNRIVFTNWYYVQPGDLDWKNAEGKSVYVNGDEELFAAQHVGINAPRGVTLRAYKPAVIGPMEMPYRSILREGDIYKGWTSSEYMESADGMHWEKQANLVLDALHTDGIWHVFIDPSASPEEKYKSVWVGQITRAEFDAYREKRPEGWEPRAVFLLGEKDEVSCIRGSVSPDGITWTTLPEPLVVEYCDTLNTCYYDPAIRKYVLYTRFWSVGLRTDKLPPDIRGSWTGVGRRAIGRSESDNFRHFPPSEMIVEPTPEMLPSESLYTNCRTSVPGAPEQFLMFPTVWNASVDDTTRIAMASSHDGAVWHWAPGGDILRTEAFGKWNGGCIWAFPELIELPNGDWALPYLAHNVPHKYPRGKRVGGVGYAVWEKGRMMALEAENRGECTLITVMPAGRKLNINALTQRTGWVKVEVAGVENRSFDDCVPIVGDQPWTRVRWETGDDMTSSDGQPVTLRLELNQSKVFGIEFE